MLSEISVQEHVFPVLIFAFGIELTVAHFKALFAKPRIPILGTLIHTITFPTLAVSLVSLVIYFEVELADHLLIGILLVAACPSGGFSNMLVLIAKADLALSVLLTSVSSLLSFITVPFFFWGFGQLMPGLSGEVDLPVGRTLAQLLVLVVVPVGLGMVWRATNEEFVVPKITKIQKYVQIFLYSALVVMLIQDWDTLIGGVGPALPWSLGLCFLSLSAGYWLSRAVGLSPVDCATVAIESSIRNLAVAFLIATTVLGRIDIAILPSVYFMAVLIVGLGFARFWRTRMAPHLVDEKSTGPDVND